MKELTAEHLRALFNYNPETGAFTRRSGRGRPSRCAPNNNGYHMIMIEGQRYYAHRLAWLYVYGAWPPADMVVDHIDEDRMNNEINNLRLLTRGRNMLIGHHDYELT